MQDLSSNKWHVPSTSDTNASGYIVTQVNNGCVECKDSSLTCQRPECVFLCYHMYTCSCYDFTNGHVCKHIHRVHSLYLTRHNVPLESTVCESSNEDQATPVSKLGDSGDQPTTAPSEAMDKDLEEDFITGVTFPKEKQSSSTTTGTGTRSNH